MAAGSCCISWSPITAMPTSPSAAASVLLLLLPLPLLLPLLLPPLLLLGVEPEPSASALPCRGVANAQQGWQRVGV